MGSDQAKASADVRKNIQS